MIAAVGAVAFEGLVNKITTGNVAGITPNPNQKGILKAGDVGGGGAANVLSGSLMIYRFWPSECRSNHGA